VRTAAEHWVIRSDEVTMVDLPPVGTNVFRPDAQHDQTVAFMVMLLDLQDADRSIRRLRDWAIGIAEVGRGDVVVDVGSGTGTVARELAGLVGPEGSVTGIEPNPVLRDLAQDRAGESGSGARFLDALATALPLPDASVDVLWCERVLQHLDDPQSAVNEFARVLRPGGRALLLDSDHATRITSDVDRDVEAALNRAFTDRVANPFVGRAIPRFAVSAGLEVDEDVGAAVLGTGPAIMRDAPMVRHAGAQAIEDGTITAAQLDTALDRIRAAADAGWAFSAVTIFGFCARRPAAAPA
jgi:ubiquinone/menaquinone biosynthesis C-methylase UbiE